MELKFILQREMSRNNEACEIAAALAKQSEPGKSRGKWLREMQGTADSPPEQRKLLAEYRRQVEANPADAETWELIGEIAAGTEDLGLAKQAFEKLITLRPGDLVAHKRLAELYEWSNDPGRAFDIYAKLAEQKDDAALDRLIALNPGLYRDKDVLRLLRAAVGEANGDKYL